MTATAFRSSCTAKESRMTLVSVIIPTKDRPAAVVDAVHSVMAGVYQQFEIFVIDQSADTATADALIAFAADPRFHYVRNRRPGVGAASSRNVGIALSSGEIVAIIDDDVTAGPDWMARIVAEFAADPELQFICGRLAPPPETGQAGLVPTFEPRPDLTAWEMPIEAAGANFSMRRALFDRVGGYDEFCGPGSRLGASDDGDLSFRIMRSGAKWKASREIEVVHTHGFRNVRDADALYRRYQRGIGGNFGRFARRGDAIAGLWFGQDLLRHLLTTVAPNVIRGRRPTGLGLIVGRLAGFRKGFLLSPREGFVDGAALADLRRELRAAAPVAAGR
jgi:glycosyltransferase involved in cell wall biosynthesis